MFHKLLIMMALKIKINLWIKIIRGHVCSDGDFDPVHPITIFGVYFDPSLDFSHYFNLARNKYKFVTCDFFMVGFFIFFSKKEIGGLYSTYYY